MELENVTASASEGIENRGIFGRKIETGESDSIEEFDSKGTSGWERGSKVNGTEFFDDKVGKSGRVWSDRHQSKRTEKVGTIPAATG
jgi:hypothetical protein